MKTALVTLGDVHDKIHAGCGNSRLTVRTLDGVTIQIMEGELLIVHGHSSSDGRALKTALAARSRTFCGERWKAEDVEIRSASISPRYCETVERAWREQTRSSSDRAQARQARQARARHVYLLSDSQVPASYSSLTERKCWEWSIGLRDRGGAVVMFEKRRQRGLSKAAPMLVREPSEAMERARVRRFLFTAGRLLEEPDAQLHSISESSVAAATVRTFGYARQSPDSE